MDAIWSVWGGCLKGVGSLSWRYGEAIWCRKTVFSIFVEAI